MPPIEIDDIEFEHLLEKVIELWAEKKDTKDMSLILGHSEAKIDYVLSCLIEGMYHCREDEAVAAEPVCEVDISDCPTLRSLAAPLNT